MPVLFHFIWILSALKNVFEADVDERRAREWILRDAGAP